MSPHARTCANVSYFIKAFNIPKTIFFKVKKQQCRTGIELVRTYSSKKGPSDS